MRGGHGGVFFPSPGPRSTRATVLGVHIMVDFISDLGTVVAVDKSR